MSFVKKEKNKMKYTPKTDIRSIQRPENNREYNTQRSRNSRNNFFTSKRTKSPSPYRRRPDIRSTRINEKCINRGENREHPEYGNYYASNCIDTEDDPDMDVTQYIDNPSQPLSWTVNPKYKNPQDKGDDHSLFCMNTVTKLPEDFIKISLDGYVKNNIECKNKYDSYKRNESNIISYLGMVNSNKYNGNKFTKMLTTIINIITMIKDEIKEHGKIITPELVSDLSIIFDIYSQLREVGINRSTHFNDCVCRGDGGHEFVTNQMNIISNLLGTMVEPFITLLSPENFNQYIQLKELSKQSYYMLTPNSTEIEIENVLNTSISFLSNLLNFNRYISSYSLQKQEQKLRDTIIYNLIQYDIHYTFEICIKLSTRIHRSISLCSILDNITKYSDFASLFTYLIKEESNLNLVLDHIDQFEIGVCVQQNDHLKFLTFLYEKYFRNDNNEFILILFYILISKFESYITKNKLFLDLDRVNILINIVKKLDNTKSSKRLNNKYRLLSDNIKYKILSIFNHMLNNKEVYNGSNIDFKNIRQILIEN